MLSTYIEGYNWTHYSYLNPVSFLEGPQGNPTSWVNSLPMSTAGDFYNYIARLQAMPKQLDEFLELLKTAVLLNRTYNAVSMNRLEVQFNDTIKTNPIESPYYTPFNGTLDNSTTIDESDKTALRTKATASITSVMDKFQELWNYIQTVYKTNTRKEYGVWAWPNGRKFYETCIRWYLDSDLTADQIHKIGLNEVARIEANMRKIMTKQGHGDKTIAEYFQILMNDSTHFFKTGDEILEEYRRQVNEVIEPRMKDWFINRPGLPLIVKSTPYDGISGSYTSGSPDGSTPGKFWVNVFRPKDTPKYTMMALTLHEAIPGHHLQISHSITADTPDFRKKMESSSLYRVPFAFPRYTAYVEGWALYAEAVGEEMGVYGDDYELMGRYNSEMFRACRLVIDTGIHEKEWSREQAIEYMLNYTSETRPVVETEIDRYITWPGQALSYKIGEIKIRELRAKAEKELGQYFDIKEFHSVVLESGTLSLNVLENIVNTWIENHERGGEPPVPCGASGLSTVIPLVLLSFVSKICE
ncbi:uncharacterized protein LOC121369351 [Gigantopelta aegis]|uniref:uncharacterized protein LOC121369351 n=1 Tax=Gigantopelta aegis TaxID=1735272 RepID=UPI001B88E245|nr:uncharacterized protein LOC121369351 [Gigantopelta aegis]